MGRKYKIVLGLAPIFVLYGWLIVGGIINMLIESLGYIPNLGFMQWGLSAYIDLVSKDGFILDLGFSLFVSLLATTLSIIIGVLLAYYLAITDQKFIKRTMANVLKLGTILPYLYMIFIVVMTFGRTGILSRFLLAVGFIDSMDQMPSVLYSQWGIGIILTFVAKGIPFVTLFTMNVMANINDTYEDVAKVLGCNRLKLFFKLYVPLSRDVIVWTSAVLLAYSFGSFEVPFILSSLKPTTLSVDLFSAYSSPSLTMIPNTMAITIIMFVIGGLLILSYTLLLRRLIRGYLR